MRPVGAHAILYKTLEGRDHDSCIGILLQKRNLKGRIYTAHWQCFGGGIEPNEAPYGALMREMGEEVEGLIVDFYEPKTIDIPIYRAEVDLGMIFYVGRVRHMEIRLRGDESLGYGFFTPEEIHHLMVRPEDRAAIGRFLQERGT